jgi:tetratricopeptide (TPR) repeat protein
MAAVLGKGVVCCIVLHSSEESRLDAESADVRLVSLDRPNDEEFLDSFASDWGHRPELQGIRWWIGHDVITGSVANAARRVVPGSRSAVIMHTSYDSFTNVKHGVGKGSQQKTDQQRQIFPAADQVFAIGPLLAGELKNLGINGDDRMIVPGLPVVDLTPARTRLNVLTFGRFDEANRRLKQVPLAVAALARAVAIVSPPAASWLSAPSLFDGVTLKVIGLDDSAETMREIETITEKYAGRAIETKAVPYVEDRATLLREIEGANLCLILSWHEGFSLVAWESIGAAIPMILSRNTGVYRLLETVGGMATGCVEAVTIRASYGKSAYKEEDLEEVAQCIVRTAGQLENRLEDARSLRRLLTEQVGYTWPAAIRSILSKLGVDVPPDKAGASARSEADGDALEFVETSVDLNHINALIDVAGSLLRTGYYERSLTELGSVDVSAVPLNLRAKYMLVRAEALLRLNHHDEASNQARRALKLPEKHLNWDCRVAARGIVNTVHRALGQYEDAVQTARELVADVSEFAPEHLGRAKRDLARSLALVGEWKPAVEAAESAIELARAEQSILNQAKSFLALGEAHRHGFAQRGAIEAYETAVRYSARAGHNDCLLWSALGLADSFFLQGRLDEARDVTKRLAPIVHDRARRFPLETLHYDLTLSALDLRAEGWSDALDELIFRYAELGVRWPEEYIKALRRGDYSMPKRM